MASLAIGNRKKPWSHAPINIEATAARPHNSFPDIVAVKGRVFWVLFLKRYLLFVLCESAANTRQSVLIVKQETERRSIDMIREAPLNDASYSRQKVHLRDSFSQGTVDIHLTL